MTSEINETRHPVDSPAADTAVAPPPQEDPSESPEADTMRRLLRDLDIANDWHPDC